MKAKFLFIPFMLLFAVAVSSFTIKSALLSDNERINGNGVMKTEERPAGNFREINTSAVYKVRIRQGSNQSIKIEAEENLLPYIVTEISGDQLSIHTKKGYQLNIRKDVIVYVTTREISRLSASGASGFISEGELKSDRIKLDLSGAANAELKLNVQQLKAGLSGASNVRLQGRATIAEYGISGAADISAADLQSDEVEVGVSGAGKATVHAVKKLDAGASGTGRVRYTGNPEVKQAVSGMGRVSRAD